MMQNLEYYCRQKIEALTDWLYTELRLSKLLLRAEIKAQIIHFEI